VSGLRVCGVAVLLIEKERNCVDAGAIDSADLRNRSTKLARQLESVDLAAAGLHEVAHVKENQRGQALGENGRCKHELARQMKRVENEKDRVGFGRARHAAAQDVTATRASSEYGVSE
jgi:hypothetical protein